MGRLFGEWNQIGHLLKIADHKMKEEAKQALEECAEIYEEKVYEIIKERPDEWPELTESWVERKGHSRFYEESGEFISNIGSRGVRGSYSGEKIFVGASPWKTHKGSNLRMDVLAEILQYKYERPLFQPAWERAKPEIKKRMSQVGAEIFSP